MDDLDDDPPMICKVTGMYCTGQHCEDYGCAKECGIYDDYDEE